MFGIMEAVLSFLRRQIGLRTDVADVAGSVHAKIAELRNVELTKYQKPRGTTKISWNINSTSLTDILNVSGRGELICLVHKNYNSSGDHAQYEIAVDGNIIGRMNTGSGGTLIAFNYYKTLSAIGITQVFTSPDSGDVGFTDIAGTGYLGIKFKTSLVIKTAKTGTNSSVGSLLYAVE